MADGLDGWGYVSRVHMGRELIGRVGEVGIHGLYRLKEVRCDLFSYIPISAALFCSYFPGWW